MNLCRKLDLTHSQNKLNGHIGGLLVRRPSSYPADCFNLIARIGKASSGDQAASGLHDQAISQMSVCREAKPFWIQASVTLLLIQAIKNPPVKSFGQTVFEMPLRPRV